MTKLFHSKLLLFGEYGLIKGGKGLAFPLRKYSGLLKVGEGKSKLDLMDFISYCEGSKILSNELDLKKLKTDNENGLIFDSNIPIGSGVGSSGALCASIFASYSKSFSRKDQYSSDELGYLKDLMALMESFYHGSSSGIDCLISLIDKPLFLNGRNNFSIYDNLETNMGFFYLYQTGVSRKTAPLVHLFLDEFDNNQAYKKDVFRYIESSDKAIEFFISKDKKSFGPAMKELNKIQYKLFDKMICDDARSLWESSLENDELSVKLCGAGGGGFYLVYSPNERINHPKYIEVNL